jgi:membrane protease YdiL (CAAX protease family)
MRISRLSAASFDPRQRLISSGVLLAVLLWMLSQHALDSVSWPALWLVVGAPVVEEVIFRLGLQQELLQRLQPDSAWLANGITALVFSVAHALSHSPVMAMLTLLPALFIGNFYQRSRRLAPCIALHAFFNVIWLALPGLNP